MASFAAVLQDWAEGEPDKRKLYAQYQGLVLRWMNEAQLRYCDKSEMLQAVWSATVTSGSASLPADFLREIQDRVKWDTSTYLVKIDYPTANLVSTFTTTQYYSIWNGSLYVWASASGSPTVPYIKKPAVVAIANIGTTSLEIPTEYHHNLLLYLDAWYSRRLGKFAESKQLLTIADNQARQDGIEFHLRRDPPPVMKSSRF